MGKPFVILWLLLLAVGSCDSKPQPAATVAAPATRIVSLTPSATEVIAALGASQFLVGVDDYSHFPAEVAALPKVGSFLSPNLEVILRLRPTLVVADDIHDDAAAALRDMKVDTVIVPMHNRHDIEMALTNLGSKLSREQAAKDKVAAIRAAVDAAGVRRPGETPPRVLAIIDREVGGLGGLVAAGTGSWIDELLAILGAHNVMVSAGVRYPKISVEEVLLAQPDIIIDASYSAEGSTASAAWDGVNVPAVANHRVVVVREPYVLAPSPRIAEALTVLRAALSPPTAGP